MVAKKARELNQVLKESNEYLQYVEKLHKVKDNVDLYKAMNVFRIENEKLQNQDCEDNSYQKICDLRQEYDHILNCSQVKEFLIAEQLLSKKMVEAYELMVDGLELDYTYMES